ncbi:MAG: MAPEG family protein [Myxococcota bacterium]
MPEVTAATAAICALVLVAMSADVAYQRRRHAVPLQGFGDNKHVNRAMRAHGNFTEHVPLALLLLLVLELGETSRPVLIAAGSTLVLGRLLHWYGLKTSSGMSFGRAFGVGATWLVLVGEALVLSSHVLAG